MEEKENIKDAIDSFLLKLDENEESGSKNENKNIDLVRKEKSKENHGFKKLTSILKKILELICDNEKIIAKPNKKETKISIYGKGLAIAIGKNGKNMEAIEYIINLIGKRKKLIDKEIIIDIVNYRKKNIDRIKKIAIEMANKAVKENKKIALKPMPNYERKIIHKLLSNIKNIRTESKNEGEKRRIIIYPVINKS